MKGCGDPEALEAAIVAAIDRTLPDQHGQRHRQIFEFARELKAIVPDWTFDQLEPYWRNWHDAARPNMRTTDLITNTMDFVDALDKVKFPAGSEPIRGFFDTAVNNPVNILPEYGEKNIPYLVALCRELQLAAGRKPFYLSYRAVGRLFNISHTQAGNWLKLLVLKKVLKVVEPGKRKQATTYRYLLDIQDGST